MRYPFRRSGIMRTIENTNIKQELIYSIDGNHFWQTIYEPTEEEKEFVLSIIKDTENKLKGRVASVGI